MEWISVYERLPEIGIKVLLFSQGGFCFTGENTGAGWATYGTNFTVGSTNMITHWMPLPPPPTKL